MRTYQEQNENNKNNKDNYVYIVEYLNYKTNKNFKLNSKITKKYIYERLNEKYTLEDFKKVIDVKVSHWLGDPKMEMYFRPETLFGIKFENYLNEKTRENSISKRNGFHIKNNRTDNYSNDKLEIIMEKKRQEAIEIEEERKRRLIFRRQLDGRNETSYRRVKSG